MNQKEYLAELESEIELLDEEIAEDIIEYYRNRFTEEKRYENKTEEQIIKELGKPLDLAHRIYESYGIKKELWESAREEEVDPKKAIPVLAFDVFVASWTVPLLIFLVLAGFATFITFPFVIFALPGLVFQDAFLIILLAIGSYSILLLLVLGLTELSLVVFRNILIMNFKILTPQNKTTTRMLKQWSLFQWMRTMKMGRNIFINLGMVGLTLMSMSFIMLVNSGAELGSVFGGTQKLTSYDQEDLIEEIRNREAYTILLDVGNMDVNFNRNSSSQMTMDHEYNYEDYFTYEVDKDANTIILSTLNDQIREGLVTPYEGSLTISIPEDLIIKKLGVQMGNGDVNMMSYEMDDFEVNKLNGDVLLYDVNALSTTIQAGNSNITVLESFFDDLRIQNVRGYVALKTINNMLNDGYLIDLDVPYGRVNLSNIYFRDFQVDTFTADVFLNNNNDLYVVNSISVHSVEGNVYVQDIYRDILDQE